MDACRSAMLGTLLHERYRIIRVLGAGGFGQTYVAEDTQRPDHPRCVVKHLKPASQDSVFLEIARRLFQTEVQTLEKLGQHDQIPELLDHFEEDQEFYLVQEFIEGRALNDELSQEGQFNEAEAIALLRDVLVVLEFVHNNRVIHRDIKPNNLIRRQWDGKFILIDFGAVKEIRTQLLSGTGHTSFTVGIGTEGYTPSEQLAGKPKFCSDIYSLGVTVIQALTGLPPSQLPDDPDTSEILWQDYAHVNPGLEIILDKMIRYHFTQRYQSATQVLQSLERMSDLPTDLTLAPPALLEPSTRPLTPIVTPIDVTQLTPLESWRDYAKRGACVVAIASLAVTSFVLGIRQLGWLQPLELVTFDQMVRLRTDIGPDPRLLVVGITEADLQALQRPTPSDRTLAQALEELEQHEPAAIGLDLYRDVPQEPGQTELLSRLQSSKVFTVTLVGEEGEILIPAPPGVPQERVGFSDIPVDRDNVVRRNLMFASTATEEFYSFSLRLALQYLAAQNIQPQKSEKNPDYMQLSGQTFIPLDANSGGYQTNDPRGYQILLNYRSAQNVARQVSLTDVLNKEIDPSWVNNKIVLIGTTAPSSKDLFYTPFSATAQGDHQMPGILVHAQMVSQILSSALDGQPLFWFWSEWVEIVWITGWAVIGGSLAWYIRHPLFLSLNSTAVLITLSVTCFIIFIQQGWVPVVAPIAAFLLTGGAVVTYRTYQPQKAQQIEVTRLMR